MHVAAPWPMAARCRVDGGGWGLCSYAMGLGIFSVGLGVHHVESMNDIYDIRKGCFMGKDGKIAMVLMENTWFLSAAVVPLLRFFRDSQYGFV